MKRFLCVLLACVMLLSLCACGGKADASETPELSAEQAADASAEVQ